MAVRLFDVASCFQAYNSFTLSLVPTDIFPHRAAFDPTGDLDAFLKTVPAKWVVYLLADEHDRPVQLLCVKNLRASLKRRLGTGEDLAPRSKRVDYRDIVRRIHWRRVDSAFEADAVYLEAARHTFPQTYRGMTGFRPAWFVHVDPAATHPRYTKTVELGRETGVYLGPLEDKHDAQKLVHLAERLFDLCRDYSIFTQSPRGGPCAWKQMGKCVGPCDGTVSLGAYRDLIDHSVAVLSDPADHVRAHTHRMKQAAAELRFETAEKIKQYVDQLAQLGKGPLRHVRPLRDFTYVSLQRGPREGLAKVFLVTPGQIGEIAGIVDEPARPAELLRLALELAARRETDGIGPAGAERIGVVAHHLFLAKATRGVFIPLSCAEEKAISKGYRELLKQKVEPENEGEGVVKELQAL
jgi:excinuclease UvrABC nuclease subunit